MLTGSCGASRPCSAALPAHTRTSGDASLSLACCSCELGCRVNRASAGTSARVRAARQLARRPCPRSDSTHAHERRLHCQPATSCRWGAVGAVTTAGCASSKASSPESTPVWHLSLTPKSQGILRPFMQYFGALGDAVDDVRHGDERAFGQPEHWLVVVVSA